MRRQVLRYHPRHFAIHFRQKKPDEHIDRQRERTSGKASGKRLENPMHTMTVDEGLVGLVGLIDAAQRAAHPATPGA
jgi:hypothetical protein